MSGFDFSGAAACLEQGCGSAFPGAVACVLHEGELVFHHAVGNRATIPTLVPNTVDTIYDLASLTKPMAVGSVLMAALEDGQLDLDESVGGLLAPRLATWQGVHVRHLADHTSGLPAWRDLKADLPASAGSAKVQDHLRQAVFSTAFEAATGERACYSDLGYMALGWFLERKFGATLDSLLYQQAQRFSLGATRFCPAADDTLAPTELDSERGLIRGTVHDPNAWLMGGVAGHAGLFGTALDVGRWAQSLVNAWQGENPALSKEVLKALWMPDSPPPVEPSTWRLCFDSVSPSSSSSGQHFGSGAVGHLGYTGCSLWIEPTRQWVVVLLSNRVHPHDENHNVIKVLRPAFHDLVADTIQAGN
jgi:CubicO group peptidase (beta-lactamase class C family)